MYSLVLTELGITVFDGDEIKKTFQFRDMIRQYIAVKKKESCPDGLIEYLSDIQVGIKTSDESLLGLLKKESVDAWMMPEDELEQVRARKPQIMVDSGFAGDLREAQEKLREFSLGLSSTRISEISESPDMHIIHGINALDEIDRTVNTLSSGLREWYGLHFPELENIVDSTSGYAHTVLGGKRDALTRELFESAGFPESKTEMILLAASNSRGGDISEINLSMVQAMARQIVDFDILRRRLSEHIEAQMHENSPNLAAILGSTVGARILRRAGSLKRLASLPASTIQVLGAERALFRSLRTGAQPPKYGLLFQHPMVHSAPRWQRGKIARAIAAKAVIAARVDMYGDGLNRTLLEKLNVRIGEIATKYENAPERPAGRQQDRRDESNFRRRDRPGRRDSRKRPGARPKKKRKRFGRR